MNSMMLAANNRNKAPNIYTALSSTRGPGDPDPYVTPIDSPTDTKEMKKRLLQLCVHDMIICPKHVILRIDRIKCVPDRSNSLFSRRSR